MSQKPTVLIIEDESGILDTLRILLKKEGFEVTTAQGGKAVWAAWIAASTCSAVPRLMSPSGLWSIGQNSAKVSADATRSPPM